MLTKLTQDEISDIMSMDLGLLLSVQSHQIVNQPLFYQNIMSRFSWDNQDVWFHLSIFLAATNWCICIIAVVRTAISGVLLGDYSHIPLLLYVSGPIAHFIGLFGFVRLRFFGAFFMLPAYMALLLLFLTRDAMTVSAFCTIILICLTILVCIVAIRKIAFSQELFFKKNVLSMSIISCVPLVFYVLIKIVNYVFAVGYLPS